MKHRVNLTVYCKMGSVFYWGVHCSWEYGRTQTFGERNNWNTQKGQKGGTEDGVRKLVVENCPLEVKKWWLSRSNSVISQLKFFSEFHPLTWTSMYSIFKLNFGYSLIPEWLESSVPFQKNQKESHRTTNTHSRQRKVSSGTFWNGCWRVNLKKLYLPVEYLCDHFVSLLS